MCLLQYASASTKKNALPMLDHAAEDKEQNKRTNLRIRSGSKIQETAESPGVPIVSRNLNEGEGGWNTDNFNTDNINIDEYTQRPQELFSTPITEWTTEDWILAGIIFLVLSCLLSCLAKIGCGACNLLNCLFCLCCCHLCCGDPSDYVAAT